MAPPPDALTPQLPLGFSLAPGATFDSYFIGPNALAVGLLRELAQGRGELQLFLAGASGLGKTHLLQALCHERGGAGMPVAYLPLAEVGRMDPEILDGLDRLDLIVLDDIEAIARVADWERALFRLINAARTAGVRLVVAGRTPPGQLGLDLPDLASRLAWGPVLRLEPLSDAAKCAALAVRAHNLGLTLPAAVAEYLVRRYPRDLAGLLARLEELDRASLATGRRLTIPFVRTVLGRSADASG